MVLSAKVSYQESDLDPKRGTSSPGIEPGDRLSVEVVDQALVFRRRPERASDRLWGLGRGLYGPDPVTFVREIRDELEANLRERRPWSPANVASDHRLVALDANVLIYVLEGNEELGAQARAVVDASTMACLPRPWRPSGRSRSWPVCANG